MTCIPDIFACKVFDDKVMRSRLPEDAYRSLRQTIEEGSPLNQKLADAVASAMCTWAVENGATHFTHWFQPLTGITAEKHDSFVNSAPDGRAIMEFSGKELIRGEPDASSFPSGGLRATFEARGYTAWDPTSYAFIKEKTLCIPTAFCSYGGEALDKKTPLLRSMEAINRQALRILKLFGNNSVKRVTTNVGPEQEYFLVDREMYLKRKDLRYTEELWKLGIFAKTEHNEVAPAQHELAVIYTTTNVATDKNQLIMEVMKKVARKHGLVCLLHEKPFAGVNGSGKHNNWSISTDTGVNLLSPGETPHENAQFLLFLMAVIQAVDDYQDLLRLSVASAGNDHRLGANEAPPAVISIFLGDELTAVLDAIEKDAPYFGAEKKQLKLGVDILPKFPRDSTDRNRTSPFAFTGNKFEFRMVGSSDSIACPNMMLNAAVADALMQFADVLEKAKDFNSCLHDLIRKTIVDHKRIIFNGNGYDDAWIKEAVEKRGLCNLRTTPDALQRLLEEKNIRMLLGQHVFTESELRSRYEIQLENYVRTVRIEALTMTDMSRREIQPAVMAYSTDAARGIAAKKAVDSGAACRYETKLIKRLDDLSDSIDTAADELEKAVIVLDSLENVTFQALHIRDIILPKMAELRAACDEAETLTASSYWPFPTYGDLLFGV